MELISTSKLEKEFSDETKVRLLNLENSFEEFKTGITEENLRLKTPYIKDRNNKGIALAISETDSGVLLVYVGDTVVGQITLE